MLLRTPIRHSVHVSQPDSATLVRNVGVSQRVEHEWTHSCNLNSVSVHATERRRYRSSVLPLLPCYFCMNLYLASSDLDCPGPLLPVKCHSHQVLTGNQGYVGWSVSKEFSVDVDFRTIR